MTTWSRYFISQFRRSLNKFTLADMWTLFQHMPLPMRSQVEACLKGSPEGLALRFLKEQPRLRERPMTQSFWSRDLLETLNIPETLPPLPTGIMSQLVMQHKVLQRKAAKTPTPEVPANVRTDVMLNVLSILDLKLEERERGLTLPTNRKSVESESHEKSTHMSVTRPEIKTFRITRD